MSSVTGRYLIDSARTRHWAFSQVEGGDGPALLFLNSRLRTHLAKHGAKIEGLVGTTMQYAVPLAQPTLLVTDVAASIVTSFGLALSVNGTQIPQLATAYQDGWAVHLTGGGIPYIDFSEAPIAGDPFGANGGTPGFPLPADMIRLIAVSLLYSQPSSLQIPCDIIPEMDRFATQPGRNPQCFVSGNRLVPVRSFQNPTLNTADRWSNVTAILLSYVGVQTLHTLDDTLNIPTVLAEALIADLAYFFAGLSKLVPAADKQLIRVEAENTAAILADGALEMLNEPQIESVVYKG